MTTSSPLSPCFVWLRQPCSSLAGCFQPLGVVPAHCLSSKSPPANRHNHPLLFLFIALLNFSEGKEILEQSSS